MFSHIPNIYKGTRGPREQKAETANLPMHSEEHFHPLFKEREKERNSKKKRERKKHATKAGGGKTPRI